MKSFIGSFVLILWIIVILFSPNVTIVPTFAQNNMLDVDSNHQKAAAGEIVLFNATISNNKNAEDTMFINQVWEHSVLSYPISIMDDKVYDSSPFGNHGTNHGATAVGKTGGVSFSGVDEYISVPDSESLNPSVVSLEAWIDSYTPNTKTHSLIITKGNSPNPTLGYSLRYGNMYDLRFMIGNNNTVNGTDPITVNSFPAHLIAVYNGTTASIYLNGELKTSKALNQDLINGNQSLGIGGNPDAGGKYFNGTIRDINVYNFPLTQQEIKWLYNKSWENQLNIDSDRLGPSESQQVTFSAKIPVDARPGYIQKFIITVFSLSEPEYIENVTLTIEVLPKYGVQALLAINQKYGEPGETLDFQASLQNLGNTQDTYELSVQSAQTWNVSLSAESLTISPREEKTFSIFVTIPLDALPGDNASFEINATSKGNPKIFANVTFSAISNAIYKLTAIIDSELKKTVPSSEVTFSLSITNLGTANDTVQIEIEKTIDWEVEVITKSLQLQNGETRVATIKVSVPENAFIGQTNDISLRIISIGNPEVTSTSSFSIEVIPPFWEIPDVRFIIGLSLGFLVGASLTISIIKRRLNVFNRK